MSKRDIRNLALDQMEQARVVLDDELRGVREANDPLAKIRHAIRELSRTVDELPD